MKNFKIVRSSQGAIGLLIQIENDSYTFVNGFNFEQKCFD